MMHGEKRKRGNRETFVKPDAAPGRAFQAARSSSGGNPLARNLRALAAVLAVMLVFLLVAVLVAKRNWQAKHHRALRNVGAPAALATPPARPPSDLALPADGRDAEAVAQAEVLERRARAALEAGNTNRAVSLYEDALTRWPDLTSARAALGRIHLRRKDCFRARVTFEKAVQSRPDLPELVNALGAAYLCENNAARAAEEFRNALQIDPDFAPAVFNLALCRLAQGDRAAAREALDRFLALQPDHPRGLRQQAFLEAADGRYARALELLRAALRGAPDAAPLYFDAAATAALLGDVANAISYMEQAERLTSPVAVYVVFQQPAFEQVRAAEAGQAFLRSLEERARGRRAEPGLVSLLRGDADAMLSVEDSW